MTQEKIANFYEDLGTRIAFIRDKQRVTLDELSEGKPSTAQSWEQGKMPRPDRWRHISERLGLSEAFIFNGTPVEEKDYAFIETWKHVIGEKGVTYAERLHSPLKVEHPPAKFPDRPMITPRRSEDPARQPATLQDCERYFLEYLQRAEKDPNAGPYIWRQLQKHFPLDEFEE